MLNPQFCWASLTSKGSADFQRPGKLKSAEILKIKKQQGDFSF